MSLGLDSGELVTVIADGPDEEVAVEDIAKYLCSGKKATEWNKDFQLKRERSMRSAPFLKFRGGHIRRNVKMAKKKCCLFIIPRLARDRLKTISVILLISL